MNARERMESTFSPDGSKEFPVGLCYDTIFIRDHWDQLTNKPWWYFYSPNIEFQLALKREMAKKIGEDWYEFPVDLIKNYSDSFSIKLINQKTYVINRNTKEKRELFKPSKGGDDVYCVRPLDVENNIETIDDFNKWFENFTDYNIVKNLLLKNSSELYPNHHANFKDDLYTMSYIQGPFWQCFGLWGFNRTMTFLIDKPELIKYACENFRTHSINLVRLALKAGVRCIWIEDSMSDLICSEHFKYFNLNYLRDITDEIRLHGMQSIYYFCGNPDKKLPLLIDVGADALSLEESKKNFIIDIEDIINFVKGRIVIFGNLDSIKVLENGTEDDLKNEIYRQIFAGRKNKNRFVMSLGSPVTPATTIDRVRLYCDIAHSISVT